MSRGVKLREEREGKGREGQKEERENKQTRGLSTFQCRYADILHSGLKSRAALVVDNVPPKEKGLLFSFPLLAWLRLSSFFFLFSLKAI